MGFFDLFSSSEEQKTPQQAMEIGLMRMYDFNTYRRSMPSSWKNYKYPNFSLSYKIEKYNTTICIQSDSFAKDIYVGKNILECIYLVPDASGGTLISTITDNYKELLDINEKIFNNASNYQRILSVLYNTQHKLYSKYFISKEQYIDRVYLSSLINIPYKTLIKDGILSPCISNRLFEYALFALKFKEECSKYGMENFKFTKDFLRPLLSITAKAIAIADIDWGDVLGSGHPDVSLDNCDFDSSGSLSFSDLNLDDSIDASDSSNTSFNGDVSFGNKEEDNAWNKKQADHAFEQQEWNLDQAKKAADRGDISKARDYQSAASSWGSTGKDYLNKIQS